MGGSWCVVHQVKNDDPLPHRIEGGAGAWLTASLSKKTPHCSPSVERLLGFFSTTNCAASPNVWMSNATCHQSLISPTDSTSLPPAFATVHNEQVVVCSWSVLFSRPFFLDSSRWGLRSSHSQNRPIDAQC
ncbi:hypothetical protein BJX96DRAFT_159805 [Aspergillus floccosus]